MEKKVQDLVVEYLKRSENSTGASLLEIERHLKKDFHKNLKIATLNRILNKCVLDGVLFKQETKYKHISTKKKIPKKHRLEDTFDYLKSLNVFIDQKFVSAISDWKQKGATKLSEGSYGEIYKFLHCDGSSRLLKIIPVQGKNCVSGRNNIELRKALPEIISSLKLSELDENNTYMCPNFPKTYRVSLIKDRFPNLLIEAWERYDEDEVSIHPRPDTYAATQRFVLIEQSFCGYPLYQENISNALLGLSIMTQISAALAVGEAAFQLEHRDLHTGNVLIQSTNSKNVYYTIQNYTFAVKTSGKHVSIIDFSLSRIYADSKVHCITVEGISQCSTECFSNPKYIYALMADLLQNDWKKYEPKTNVYWLKHIIENILPVLPKSTGSKNQDKKALDLLMKWNRNLMKCHSALHFLENFVLPGNPIVKIIQ